MDNVNDLYLDCKQVCSWFLAWMAPLFPLVSVGIVTAPATKYTGTYRRKTHFTDS